MVIPCMKLLCLPRAITAQILKIAHDNLGHNGTIELISCLRDYITGNV